MRGSGKFQAILQSITLLATAPAAFGQFGSAIQGVLTDPSTAVVPSAAVRAINVATGVTREVNSSDDGMYRVLNLGAGNYRVLVEIEGFRSALRENVAVGINETVRVDFVLELGSLTDRITVEDRPPLVETEQGRVSGKIDRVQLRELPLNGRNLYTLISLQPGITGRGSAFFGGSASENDSFAGEVGPAAQASVRLEF